MWESIKRLRWIIIGVGGIMWFFLCMAIWKTGQEQPQMFTMLALTCVMSIFSWELAVHCEPERAAHYTYGEDEQKLITRRR